LEELTHTLERLVYRKEPIPYGYNILGSAGSGKTFLQSAFLEQCAARKVGLISMVYTGMG
jgi:pantothenate kinase-related protein Tda10